MGEVVAEAHQLLVNAIAGQVTVWDEDCGQRDTSQNLVCPLPG